MNNFIAVLVMCVALSLAVADDDISDTVRSVVKRQARPGHRPAGAGMSANMAGMRSVIGFDMLNDNYQRLIKVGVTQTGQQCGLTIINGEIEQCDCIASALGMRHNLVALMLHCSVTGGGLPPITGMNTCAPKHFCCCDLQDRRRMAGMGRRGGIGR